MATKKVARDQSTAEGHACMINRFDEATVMLPLNIEELGRIAEAWKKRMAALEATGDYPERADDKKTLENLYTAMWMLSA